MGRGRDKKRNGTPLAQTFLARAHLQCVCRFSEKLLFTSFASQHTVYKTARAVSNSASIVETVLRNDEN